MDKPTFRYWIQDKARDGSYYDSIGLDESLTKEEALNHLDLYNRSLINPNAILVLKITVPLN